MFPQIIEDLITRGMTEKQIGDRIGCSQPSVNRIRNGKQSPGYEVGAKLVELRDEARAAPAAEPESGRAAA